MTKLTNLAAILAVTTIALAGCAGREAHPVAVVQAQDASASCTAIQAEIAANESQAHKLSGQAETHNATNAVVGVVGAVLFWPALFALDLSDYEKQEISALKERDSYLQQTAVNRVCK